MALRKRPSQRAEARWVDGSWLSGRCLHMQMPDRVPVLPAAGQDIAKRRAYRAFSDSGCSQFTVI